jgi:hypothetical protein
MAAWARNATLVGGWNDKLQQLRQSRPSGLMQDGAKTPLHRLQIEAAGPLPLGEDTAQQCAYFARDLCLDCRGLFFSSAVSASFTGRTRQILSLTSIKDRSSCR